MNDAIDGQIEYTVWVSKEKRIVTFRDTEGFEKRIFVSQEEKMAYVFDLCESGYRIL